MTETTNNANATWEDYKLAKEQSREAIVQAYEALGGVVHEWQSHCRCIFHDDRHESADIRFRGSRWYFKCHRDEECFDVWDLEARKLEVSVKEYLATQTKEFHKNPQSFQILERPRTFTGEKNRQGFNSFGEALDSRMQYAIKKCPGVELEGVYPYYPDLEETYAPYIIARLKNRETGAKQFPQFHKDPKDGKWYIQEPPKELFKECDGKYPLLNRHKIREVQNVVFFEGEWCAEHFERLGIEDFAATTISGGASRGRLNQTYLQDLAGKTVFIWGDNDPVSENTGVSKGQEYVRQVIEQLTLLEPPCNIVRVRTEELGLPDKGDIVDFLETIKDKPEEEQKYEILSVLHSGEEMNSSSDLKKHYEAIARGEFDHIHFVHAPQLSHKTQAITPGSIVLLCGAPGSSKSFFVLQQAWQWTEQGFEVSLLEMEKDRTFWLKRTHAQMAGNSFLTDVDWCHDNSLRVTELYEEYKTRLDKFNRRLFTVSVEDNTDLPWVADWVESQAKAGRRIIFVDPITAASKSRDGWVDDLEFMRRMLSISNRFKTTVFLVTHPKNEAVKTGKPSMGDLAGSTAYYRFADSVLWLKKHNEDQTGVIDIGAENHESRQFRHEFQIWKSRNGAGDGTKVASLKDMGNLCFMELGEIIST